MKDRGLPAHPCQMPLPAIFRASSSAWTLLVTAVGMADQRPCHGVGHHHRRRRQRCLPPGHRRLLLDDTTTTGIKTLPLLPHPAGVALGWPKGWISQHSKALHLLRHGLLAGGGDDQHPPARPPGCGWRTATCWERWWLTKRGLQGSLYCAAAQRAAFGPRVAGELATASARLRSSNSSVSAQPMAGVGDARSKVRFLCTRPPDPDALPPGDSPP